MFNPRSFKLLLNFFLLSFSGNHSSDHAYWGPSLEVSPEKGQEPKAVDLQAG